MVEKQNITEEDTFDALRRWPFERLYQTWTIVDIQWYDLSVKSGWTWQEFTEEYGRRWKQGD